MKLRVRSLAVLLLSSGLALAQADKMGIINSRHDFRPTSAATIKAVTDPNGNDIQLCVYCHTPHNADPGPLLWNQQLGTTDFPTYTSTTLQSSITKMTTDDSSKLCLSCHDGTIALGNTVTEGQIPFVQSAAYQIPADSRANLASYGGTYGFTDDHPFAFQPNYADTAIKAPDPADRVKLIAGKIQCSSCHDPHNENTDPIQQNFLVKQNPKSALCLSCHVQPGWALSAHSNPPDALQDAKYTLTQGAHTGYNGVANNGCESCHRPHAPGVAQRLVKLPEENVCFQCHDGSVATLNIKAEFVTKIYRHPVLTTPSVHDDSESPNAAQFPMPEISAATPRHAECFDCHNSHYSQATPPAYTAQPPLVTPPLMGVRGQSIANGYMSQSLNQYEICFKCHADSANKPQTQDITIVGTGYGRNPARQSDFNGLSLTTPLPTRANTRLEFTTRVSFHPVTQASNLTTGISSDVPSLRPYILAMDGTNITARPLNSGSVLFCSDCHNNDSGRNLGAGTPGPNGPHASNIVHLLERAYPYEQPPAIPGSATAGVSYSPSTYALCDKCHDVQNNVMQDKSFKLHNKHVNAGATCATCHDSHSATNPMLINFDLAIVAGSQGTGSIQYTRSGSGHGSCTLSCHGQNHEGLSY